MLIIDKQKYFIKTLNQIDTWENKYLYLIQIGMELPIFPYLTEKDKIPNCMSKSFFKAYKKNNKILIQAKSNSKIISGLMYIIYKVYNNENYTNIDHLNFLEKTDIYKNISIIRSYGLDFMLNNIKCL